VSKLLIRSRTKRLGKALLVAFCTLCIFSLPDIGVAATSQPVTSPALTANLITVQNGVPTGANTISAGLHLELGNGWKTYWRSPGEVGFPPSLDWTGSDNVASVEFLWPAPKRFTAFGIENFGYEGDVVFPLQIVLTEGGKPALLNARVDLLVCSDICVPLDFDLTLALGTGNDIDRTSGELIAAALAGVPVNSSAGISSALAHIDPGRTTLTIALQSDAAFNQPDIFPELGEGTALGKPEIQRGADGRSLWSAFPILAMSETTWQVPNITITDGTARAFTITPEISETALPPLFAPNAEIPDVSELLWIALVAFLGGLILNAMPCVLPVLSIKISSSLKYTARDRRNIQAGFLAAAAGVMVFMWGLAAALFALQSLGVAVGWGLQFQNPFFLALMIFVLAIFSANLFGLFEIALPSSLQTRLANTGRGTGLGADFFTGLFGAVMATPCSAPFLGTAMAFALAGRGIDIALVFTALGLGLASPYLVIAAAPGMAKALPKPGRWMVWLKSFLGALLVGTALWLIWVMVGVAGPYATFTVTALSAMLVALLSFQVPDNRLRAAGSAATVVAAFGATFFLSGGPDRPAVEKTAISWVTFDRSEIARSVSRGEVVFVDVTADWCLTCKANKAIVLEREPVLSALQGQDVIRMQADWTRPDERILRFLESQDRYGIPFNAVYGPGAPNGIVLSEILNSSSVIEALEGAREQEAEPQQLGASSDPLRK
jgi:suppressor for copper-sensitivity B